MSDAPSRSSSQGLEWVRGELIAIFSDARTQLQKFADNRGDKTPLSQIASQLHTAHGALRMVEVYGAALLVEEMETLASRLASDDNASIEDGMEVLSRAIVQLPGYLDRVAGGGHDVPLVLLPLLNDMRAVRGRPLLSESSLFVLNIDQGSATPKRTAPPPSVNFAVLARKLRPHYQKSLLSWLRGDEPVNNLNRLANVCIKLESGAATTPVFQFWWVMSGIIEAIHDQGLAANAAVKRLLGQADQWLKKLSISGEEAFVADSPKNLLNNLLYYVARAESTGKRVSAIKSSFSLSELIAPAADEDAPDALQAPSVELMKTVGAAIKQDVSNVKDAIDIFVRTNSTSHEQLVAPQESLRKLGDTLGVLGLDELRQQIAVESRRLQTFIDGGRSGDEELLQIASTLIRVEAAIDEQLLGVIIPHTSDSGEAITPAAAAAAADHKKVVAAVMRECVVNLTRIKETIAQFVDNPTNLAALDNVPQLIVGISAGLNMLEKDRAAELLSRVEWHINAVTAEEDLARHTHELDRLADAIVSIEYYMDTVRSGRSDPWYMLDNAARCLESIKRQPPTPEETAQAELTEAKSSREESSQDKSTRTEARQIEAPAPTDDDTALVDATGIRYATARAVPGTDAERRAAALAEPVAGLSGQRIDPELLELFIEEAKEEVAALRRALPHWRQHPEEREVLLNMRRSFHTLKGSGRMVGAVLIGEYAWSVENLVNKLIGQDIEHSDGIVQIVDEAVDGLPALIEQLEVGTPVPASLESLMERTWQAVEAGRAVEMPATDPIAVAAEASEPGVSANADVSEVDRSLEVESIAEEAFDSTTASESEAPELSEPLVESNAETAMFEALVEAPDTDAADPATSSVQDTPTDELQKTTLGDIRDSLAQDDVPNIGAYLSDEEAQTDDIEIDSAADSTEDDQAQADDVDVDVELLFEGTDILESFGETGVQLESPEEEPATEANSGQASADDALSAELTDDTADGDETIISEVLVENAVNNKIVDSVVSEAALIEDTTGEEIKDADERALTDEQAKPALPEYLSEDVPHSAEDVSASSIVPGVVMEVQPPMPEVTQTELPVVAPAVILDPALHEIFLKESLEHLATIEEYVVAVQEQIEPFPVTVEMLRAWHTLSGSANTAGVTPAAAIANPMNQHLRNALAESLPLNQEAVDIVHRAAVTFGDIVRGINLQPGLPSTDELQDDIERLPQLVSAAKAAVDAMEGTGAQMVPGDFGAGYDPEIAVIFAEEATEILHNSEDALRGWFGQDSDSSERMEELLRHLHTLKGGARMAGVMAMGDLSHETESLLEKLREDQVQPDAEQQAIVRESFDRLHTMTEQLSAGGKVSAADDLIAALVSVENDQDSAKTSPSTDVVVTPTAPPTEAATDLPISSADVATVEQSNELVTDSQAAAGTTSVDEVIDTSEAEQALALTSQADDQEIADQPPHVWAKKSPEKPAEKPVEKARIDASLLDEMLNNAGEVSIFHSRLEEQVGSISFNLTEHQQTVLRLREQLRKLEIETEAQILHRHQDQSPRHEEFDPLELDRYSGLQQLSRALAESVSDLVSLQDLMSDIARESESLLVQQARVTGELQDALIRSRMLPFSNYQSRFERIVRQAAMEQGKEAGLTITGASGELDRQVLQRMLPPFEHMLRNAVIHGIESKSERSAAGKPAAGTLRIDLKREGAEMVIRVRDDGRGLDADAILAKARSLGLVDANSEYSQSEAQNLIFRHGFSTAEKITQSAGRGVGMDVVANEVKELGGSLQVDSDRGQGTTVTVRLPLTLAVSQALLVRCADERFAIPLPAVEGVVRAPLSDVSACIQQNTTYEHDEVHYTVRMLSPFLGASEVNLNALDGPSVPLILVRVGDRQCAMLVDELLGSREVVVKSAGPMVASIEGIAGATILGDGSIVVILDIASLVRNATDQRDASEYVVAESSEDLRPVVLVVDDSITVRRVTQRLLERNGMRVLLAKDGVDAVAVMQEQVPDLVLLDIEMPRMDGYEVATHIRNTDSLQHVPITMITSRVGEKHRARAFELGVDKYLGKPYQENQLLDVIQPMLERSIKQRS